MEEEQIVTFGYPYKLGYAMIWIGLPLLGVIILILFCASIFWLYQLEIGSDEFLFDLLKGGLVLGVSIWMLASFFHWCRDRHAFVTEYTLSQCGVYVEASAGPSFKVPWTEFECAVDNFTLRYIKIYSKNLDRPVTLLFGTPGTPHNYELAKELVRSKLRVVRRFW
ncbi:MAG: hypothetical protein IBX64_12435 [Actinobacteria bacterium]|nr:hypothetical protein [Actinomycetota bacterium]